ncbi:glycoside hydrolase family 25 protein [Fulvimarina endophytica]|uniref:glycoside hydrolase family 25 protein n=1 Tax=Fulvimarina endophytica TaxID=2293836 RepID=UPI0018F6D43D|nr:glycoside hydrolase family 25 protein [Fulvimarina endophytica]
MTTTNAASATGLVRGLVLAIGLIGLFIQPSHAAWTAPWKDPEKALVIDAYEFNPIDWEKMTADERIVGFISKASDGLPPAYRCTGLKDDAWKLCTNRWWRYSVTKELYMTRRQIADAKDMLWGAYHLARPGNPREQADHFIDFAEPREKDLIALDIEDLSDEFMSLEDAEIFADQVKVRTGRYPVLYTNGNTAKFISDNRADYPLLSRLPLWYARYTGDIAGKFPEDTWPNYALWQFSSMHNCNRRSCPYRVDGTRDDIDVNVATLNEADLRKAWPFEELHDLPPVADEPLLVASGDEDENEAAAGSLAVMGAREDVDAGGLLAAYGSSQRHRNRLDPLELLNTVAAQEPKRAHSHVRDQLEDARTLKIEGAAKTSLEAEAEKAKSARTPADAKGESEASLQIGEPAPGMPVPSPNPKKRRAAKSEPAATPERGEPASAEETEAVSSAKPKAQAEVARLPEKENVARSVMASADAAGEAADVAALPMFGETRSREVMARFDAALKTKDDAQKTDPAGAVRDGDARISSAFDLTRELTHTR